MNSSFYMYGEWGYLEVDLSDGRTVREIHLKVPPLAVLVERGVHGLCDVRPQLLPCSVRVSALGLPRIRRVPILRSGIGRARFLLLPTIAVVKKRQNQEPQRDGQRPSTRQAQHHLKSLLSPRACHGAPHEDKQPILK